MENENFYENMEICTVKWRSTCRISLLLPAKWKLLLLSFKDTSRVYQGNNGRAWNVKVLSVEEIQAILEDFSLIKSGRTLWIEIIWLLVKICMCIIRIKLFTIEFLIMMVMKGFLPKPKMVFKM
ncbi:uncharacterized protein LOC110710091 [Chenopodium quinoa]|uniref:uncharacterized protein LOC110710091 n=1 Tax=Chenopodium quinoa TaxID=63459 RepID=UPI000B789E5E|nr:uncharacterized protein LOC110710091 [Chenopodium quinoa]